MFNFGTQELILVLVIALVVFGPGKLPEVGKAIGKGINEFKDAVSSDKKKTDAKVSDVAKTETIDVEAGEVNEKKHKEVE
ncbi:twin-arginine translocase TatA/TatE family subunit [uncultured Veillonella sp.]|uniref:Sec-independent protein translocase subunit TatA/TatB n=1 Tax=uncultured Veillonella sp. TaxID=159268 RepID=UPI0025ED6B57|nr:twin-arginine translocase TatA/TatE family subunit [uncultured Veillonella sp.]MDY3973965.1 twin-arginine translocase TatA/TatE family subunit [Veillonella caviae]